jgi:hypothetical protein
MRDFVLLCVVSALLGCGPDGTARMTPSQTQPEAGDGSSAIRADGGGAANAGVAVAAAVAADASVGADAGIGADACAGAFDAGVLDAGLVDLLPPLDATTPPPHDAAVAQPDLSSPGVACVFPLANCDHNDRNGCETDLTSDANHCGACGTVCPKAQPDCVAGACSATARRVDIGEILRTCPQSDPEYAQIRRDFQLRSNGVVIGDVPCTEPPSAMPLDQYSDELITLQALRAIYYMDFSSAPLPWTNGANLYQWMKSKIGGIDLFDHDPSVAAYCCNLYDGRFFIAIGRADDLNRDFDRRWVGLSGRIALYGHEVRHVDGFSHVSCCGSGSCDQTYDENNLSPYGIQYWLNEKWLTGEVNVGYSCLPPPEVQETAAEELQFCNFIGYDFCDTKPPLVTMPAEPGGTCR